MKPIIVLLIFFLVGSASFAQKETYDLISFTAPVKWTKEIKENSISYIKTNTKTKAWCRIGIIKSTVSKGSIEADFESEWQQLIVKSYHSVDTPTSLPVMETDGWKIKSGQAKFTFDNKEALSMLTTMSGSNRCMSIVTLTNSKDYLKDVEAFLSSIQLIKPGTNSVPSTLGNNTGKPPTTPNNATSATNTGFVFNTTNFDDGWTSKVQEDWVEVTKDNIKVLLHYPKEGTIFPADPEPLVNAVWNILVAPRYSSLTNYQTSYINTYDRPYLGFGNLIDNATGKQLFVLLFRRSSGWIEFITPDKNAFIKFFKFDPYSIRWDSETDLLKPLEAMEGYNKFAVGASDFKGKWTSDFTGIQQMYHVYTGQYAGMNMNQSNEEFNFKAGNTYDWKLLVVNGMVGNIKFADVKSSGKFTVLNNWQVQFSKIEKGPKTCNAFFSCIKGARILHLLDAQYPGSGIPTKYGMVK